MSPVPSTAPEVLLRGAIALPWTPGQVATTTTAVAREWATKATRGPLHVHAGVLLLWVGHAWVAATPIPTPKGGPGGIPTAEPRGS